MGIKMKIGKAKDKLLKVYTKVDYIGLAITLIVIVFPFVIKLPEKIEDYYFVFMFLFLAVTYFYLAYINYFLKIDLALKPKYHTTKIMPIFWTILNIIGGVFFFVSAIVLILIKIRVLK